ncbi:MAG: ABC transporter ATP-binding protein, partial [Planctomycetes bacterium]|nr:ABC transporter ATP-binding protein [Planctomycetota bacterium]
TYVYLAGRLVGMPHVDAMQRTHIVLNYVGLGEERYRPVEAYSTGMKQKVKLAQALVHHPKLLLLDEPTSGLDPRAREEILALIHDVSHAKGIHVILSTHILHDVETVCDEVVIMDRGTLVTQGPIRRLQESAAGYDVRIKGDRHAFIAALAAHSCNATVRENDVIRVQHAGGTPGTDWILRAAVEAKVQLRHLSRCRTTLEELFETFLVKSRNGRP